MLWLAGRGFVRDEGFHHASALAFDTVLALVPLLVIVAGVLRALGAWNQFLGSTIEPWLEMTLGQSPENMVTMREAFTKVIELGESADVTALGFIGVGFRQVYFRKPTVCEPGSYCARPSSARITKTALWASLILVVAALTIDWWAPLLY